MSGITKLSADGSQVGINEAKNKINEIIDDAGGDFSGDGSGNAYSTGWASSHGSVTVANGSTHTITRNLGTTDIITTVYANDSASDTGAMQLNEGGVTSTHRRGYQITNLTSNTCTVQLGNGGFFETNSSGAPSTADFGSGNE